MTMLLLIFSSCEREQQREYESWEKAAIDYTSERWIFSDIQVLDVEEIHSTDDGNFHTVRVHFKGQNIFGKDVVNSLKVSVLEIDGTTFTYKEELF